LKDLTNSNIERQNILNNKYALQRIQEYIGFTGMFFEGEYRFTKEMVVEFFNVDISTINRYLSSYESELKHNGYIVSTGKQLNEFKLQFGHLINTTTTEKWGQEPFFIKEAPRDGVPAIDLIDGDLLCEKLREYKLGIETILIEKYEVVQDWFIKL